MVYTNGSMKLRFVKGIGSYALFERLNTGDNSTKYWVIGWCTERLERKNGVYEVTWASGSYFTGSEKEALQSLQKKAC